MKIYRVVDSTGRCTWTVQTDGVHRRIEGDVLGRWRLTDEPVEPSRLLAPVAPPAIFAIGANYRAHVRETGKEVPDAPVVFAKAVTSLNHPGEPIVLPACGPDCVDYEAELAVVIGRSCRNVPRARFAEYVLGYTVANDVSARDWQQRLGQWVRAKSFDTFCPLGPCLATDLDPSDLRLGARLNGKVMQDARTSDMIFPVSELVEFLSADLTLPAGTVILTGTPSGVGMARRPPVFLRDGDVVTCFVEGIGELTNPVRSGSRV